MVAMMVEWWAELMDQMLDESWAELMVAQMVGRMDVWMVDLTAVMLV